ncbi:hypothetical protein Aph02nite_07110 [Actinoplanes philippinensis]|uniref:Uncharacterized protein n=1 Tax=Actinoplanes philippinensis TaxID=35752 RepID=A0A1I2CQR9_9ACTN|nr:hypothetical protein [Actinoplanes philippinensis]GIE74761.1 hypothetical protein Aph02nite_07110 [Actinoplanes philippinensis]SFE70123.1 hypothetical protein SAMN05421541_103121 [Actinoplanes philippinensis]
MLDEKPTLAEENDTPARSPRERTVLVAVAWHLTALAGFLANAYLVPWETASCADQPGYCVTTDDLMHILLFLGVPFLLVSFLVARMAAVPLSRRLRPSAAGALATLAGLLTTIAAATTLVAVAR